jgi:hypothetical protein
LKVNYINKTRWKKQSETKREWLPLSFLDKVCEYSLYIITYFCNYGHCCVAILKMKIFFDFLIRE